MLVYLVGVILISAALGACFAFVGGLIVLTLLITFCLSVLTFFSLSADVSALPTVGLCLASLVALNLGWFATHILGSLRGVYVLVRRRVFLWTGKP